MSIVPTDHDAQFRSLAARARSGIQSWIRRRGGSVLGATPFVLVAGMTAAALSPIAVPLLGVAATGALAGFITQLGNIGAEHIARVLRDTVTRLRAEEQADVSEDAIRSLLASQLEQALDGPDGTAVRVEIGEFLHAVGGVSTALDAAFHGGVEGLYSYIGETVHLLSQTSEEFRALRQDVLSGLAVIQRDLTRIEAAQRGQTDRIERMSTHIALLHRQLAVSGGATRPALEGRSESSPGQIPQLPAEFTGSEPELCPYPGLAAFQESDAVWFHGRERLTAELVTRLRQRLQGPSMLIVVGASGAGKSSVLRAGLIPELDTGALAVPGSESWPREVMKPGRHPLRDLALRLAAIAGADGSTFVAALDDDPGRTPLLVRQALLSGDGPAGPAAEAAPRRLVLVIDQFEEVFTLCAGEERRRFIEAVSAAAEGSADDPAPALVILGLRAGFVEHCTAHPTLRPALRDQFIVGPMNISELHDAVERPARDVGLVVEPGLADAMLTDLEAVASGDTATYDPGKLPLLAHVLRETWARRERGRLTVRGYSEAGGIKRAVAKKADEVYGSFDADGKRVARVLLEHLVSVRADAEDTRRRMTREALIAEISPDDAETARRVLDRLERERLVTADQDTVQIAHEALLRYWPVFGRWLDEHRAWLRVSQRLTERAGEWKGGERHPDLLLRGAQLSAVYAELDDDRRGELGALESEFLQASERRQTRADRRRISLAVTLTAVFVVAVALAVIALNNSAAADRQHAIAQARRLAAEADARRATDPEVALLLSLAAYRVAPGDAEAVNGLLSTQTGFFTQRLTHGTGSVNAVAYAPGGGFVAAADQGGNVVLWDTGTLKATAPLRGKGPFYAVAVDPAGKLLAAGQQDGTTILWDVASRERLAEFKHGPDAIATMAFSPDGNTLATAGYDGTVRLWSVRTKKEAGSFTVGNGTISSVAFSPDGHQLAAACTDGKTRIWNPAEPGSEPERTLSEHTGLVRAVAFNHDGTLLASGGDDSTVRLWDPHTGTQVAVLSGAAGPVRSVAFSPDDTQLASSGQDDAVRLWDIDTRTQTSALIGPSDTIAGIAFNPDGRTIVGAGTDATVGIWNVATPQSSGGAAVVSVAATPRSPGLIATSGPNQKVYLWQSSRRRLYKTLDRPDAKTGGPPTAMAFNQDGTALAASAPERGVTLWDVAHEAVVRTLVDPKAAKDDDTRVDSVAIRPTPGAKSAASPADAVVAAGGVNDSIYIWGPGSDKPFINSLLGGPITTVAFSPDGSLLAAGSQDGTILLLRVTVNNRGIVDGDVAGQLTGPSGPIKSVAFSPDGRTLAAGAADGTVRLWDTGAADRPTALATVYGQSQAVVAVAFNDDGTRLASSAADHTIRLWNVADPAAPAAFAALTTPSNPSAVAFEPGTGIVVGSAADGTALFWDTDARAVADRICASDPAAAARVFTPLLVDGDYPDLCP